MKKNIIFILACIGGLVASAVAQTTTEFEVDGLKVIYKQSPKEIVSVRFFVQGGTANYAKEKEGIESFAFNLAVEGGSKTYPKQTFNAALEKMGTTINANSTYDYGQFNMSCINKYWNESWDLFADAILNPAFSEEEYGILKEKLIANAKQEQADADSKLMLAAMENVFKGQDYEKNPNGTESSLAGITLEQLKAYYQATLVKKRSFLVIVGDLDVSDLKAKISSLFAKLPAGTMPDPKPRVVLNSPSNTIEDREIATNYIRGMMSAPTLASDDGVAMMLAMSILRDRYFVELRTKRGLTYAPGAFYSTGIIDNPYNTLYVSTTDPKQSIEVMVTEINKLKKDGFAPDELENKQQTFLTGYFMDQETLNSQSNALGLMEMKGGWEMMDAFTDKVNKVSLADINRVINKYSDVINWTYLGKATMIDPKDFLQPGNFPENTTLEKK